MGRPLAAPRGQGTRPTADKVRGAIFNVLAARGTGVEGAAVLDLFAGTGSLGIEALSRGASSALFVESAAPAVAALERNLATLDLAGGAARVRRAEVLRVLGDLAAAGARFDLVFVDPPYAANLAGGTIERLAALGLVAPAGVVIAEHGASEPLASRYPSGGGGDQGPGLVAVRRRSYGRTGVTFFARDF